MKRRSSSEWMEARDEEEKVSRLLTISSVILVSTQEVLDAADDLQEIYNFLCCGCLYLERKGLAPSRGFYGPRAEPGMEKYSCKNHRYMEILVQRLYPLLRLGKRIFPPLSKFPAD